MSLKFLHQVIIFAAITISLIFAAWCFASPDAVGVGYTIVGVVCLFAVVGLIAYEISFLKKTKRLIIQ